MHSVADSDLELKGGGGGGGGGFVFVLPSQPDFLPSAFFSIFTQNRGWGRLPGPLTGIACH